MIWSAPLLYYLSGMSSVVNDMCAYGFQLPAKGTNLQQISREIYFPFKTQTLKRIKRNNFLDNSLEEKIDKAVSNEAKDFAKSYQRVVRPILRTKIKAEVARDKAVEARDKAVEAMGTLAVKVKNLEKDLANVTQLLEKQKGRCDSYQVLLGIRNEFENELMGALYPESFPKTKDRYLKCVLVLISQTGQMVEKYRSIIKSSDFNYDEFCSLSENEIYSPKSEIVHNIQVPEHCLTLAHYESIIQHDEQLKKFINEGHKRHELISTILKLRQARLHSNGSLGAVKFPETSGKCILIWNVPFVKNTQHDGKTTLPQTTILNVSLQHEKKNRYMPAKQIKAIFKDKEAKTGIQTICETQESNDERQTTGKVLVEFFKPRQAALGLLEHQKSLNMNDITTEFVFCEDFDCAEEDIVRNNVTVA